MRILILSSESNGGDLALRLSMEGNEVRLCVFDPKCKKLLNGMITKIAPENWKEGVSWAELVVFDDTGLDEQNQYVLKSGKPAYGSGFRNQDFDLFGVKFHGSVVAHALEKNRKMSQDIMRSLKMGNPIESLQIRDVSEAIEHIKEHPVAHVVKVEGTTGDSGKTYVGDMEDGSDVVGWLETLPDHPKFDGIKSIELEERVKGVEVACSAYFNGKDFIYPVNINFEHKKIATGNLGFNTGEMGTVMYYDPRPATHVKLFRETLLKMGDLLEYLGYRGQIDFNAIVNEDGIWGLEFTPRQGYPSSYIECELQVSKWADLLYAVAKGEDFDNHVKQGIWAIGVLLVGEGYPFWDEGYKRMDGMPVHGMSRQNIEHLHPYDLRLYKQRLVAAGSYPMTATASGDTIKAAQKMVYKEVIPRVFFPSMYYRTDIGDRVLKDLKTLDELGHDMFLKE